MKLVPNIYVAVRKLWNALFGKGGDGSSVELIKGNPTVTAEAPNLTSVEINGTKYKIELSAEQVQEAVNAYLSGDPSVFQDVVAPLIAPEYDETVQYKIGNLLTYLGKQYYCIADAPAGTLPTNTTYFEEKSVADIIEMIRNGSIVTGHSEVADNLTPYSEDSGTTQENPFISQGTGTDNNSVIVTTGVIAKQLEKQGNTVPVMQLFNYIGKGSTTASDVDITNNNDGSFTIDGTASGMALFYSTRDISLIAGHKYLVRGCPTGGGSGKYRLVLSPQTSSNAYDDGDGVVFVANINETAFISPVVSDGFTANNLKFVPQIWDITAWDSDIITDLTSNPSHFSWYYNGSLAYDAGSLQNCNGRYLECGQGRNLLDRTNENVSKALTAEGNLYDTQYCSTTDYLLVIPNRPIYLYSPEASGSRYCWAFYDKNKVCLGCYSNTNAYRTPPANAMYIRVSYLKVNADNTDISLYYSPEEGGEGYNQHYDYVAPIRIDTGNETLKAFDKKLPSGVIERNTLPEIDLSSLEWNSLSETLFYASFVGAKRFGRMISTNYHKNPIDNTGNIEVGGVVVREDQIFINTGSSSSPTGTMQLESANPITEQGSEFSEYAPINDYSYMCWLDNDVNLVSIPQGCKLFYPVDYKGFTDDLVMYTNGDATALAKNEDITDTALNARGYYKMQVLSEPLTDSAGLTYDIETVTQFGNLVNLTIRAQNLGESEITSGLIFINSLFTTT